MGSSENLSSKTTGLQNSFQLNTVITTLNY